MADKILSFGGGVQTTALAILIAEGKLEVDAVIFADTGGEKPETYWYMEEITAPLLKSKKINLVRLRNTSKYDGEDLYDFSFRHQFLPGMPSRQCSDHFKARVIQRAYPTAKKLIGFSADEAKRSDNPVHKGAIFPLIEMGLTGMDCIRIMQDFGLITPVKSSCFFCPFQRPYEWNWLKNKHPDLFEKALQLEAQMYKKHPHKRQLYGLLGGKPLWKFAEGIQQTFDIQEDSCWSGDCGR